MNESDFYRAARFAGTLFWPALFAAAAYFAGLALAQLRPSPKRAKIRRWAAGFAVFLFVVSLALSAGDLVVRLGDR